jgi:NTP pyrophosphatase (non-canonical NTP hydrolase)
MDFAEYQAKSHATAVYDPGYAQTYTVLGLVGEAGEVAQVVKRAIRDGTPQSELEAKMLLELGDCLWYLAEASSAFGWSLEAVARANIDKLASRAARGQIHGEGDTR